MSGGFVFRVDGVEQAKAALLGRTSAMVENIKTTVTEASVDLVAYVKDNKLSGQVLGNRTGRLRRSVTFKVNDNGGTVSGTVGSNVAYGRAWELGFKGDQTVKAHERKITRAFGKDIAPVVARVQAHTRKVNMPARPWLQPAMAERFPAYQERFVAAIKKGASDAA